MICVSLQNKCLEEIYRILDDPHVEMAEVRLDLCPLDDSDVEDLSESAEKPILFSFGSASIFQAEREIKANSNQIIPNSSHAKQNNNIVPCPVHTAETPSYDETDTENAGIRIENKGFIDNSAVEQRTQNGSIKTRTYPAEEMPGWEEIGHRISIAIEAGADYVDLPLDAPAPLSRKIQTLCSRNGTRLIRSYHNFDSLPDNTMLEQIVLRAFRYGADVAKVACSVKNPAEAQRLTDLYGYFEKEHDIRPERLLLIPIGDAGKPARLSILQTGAPFSFAYYDEPTAKGQMQYDEMYRCIYGDWLGVHKSDFKAPCSKSYAQRAIIAAALAQGTSHLKHYTPCGDSQSAIEVAKALGAKVHRRADTLIIEGIGPATELDITELNVGESGLLARICIPLMAGLSRSATTIQGKGTLLHRPLNDANDIMASFGVLLKNGHRHDDNKCYIPLRIEGSIIPGNAEIPGAAGSQLISGLLMTLPLCKSGVIHLKVNEPASIPYMFLTLDVLKQFGVKINCELEGDATLLENQDWDNCDAIDFTVRCGRAYKAADLELESDWSAAAAFLTYGALFGEAGVKNVNMKSTQADITILDVLSDAGAAISFLDDEVSVRRGPMHNFQYDLNNAPDIIPFACLIAAFCPGESVIFGAKRLKTKECDRAGGILQTLTKMGVDIQITGDEIHIRGMGLAQRMTTGRMLKGGKYSSFHDHRMVMLLSIAATGADSPVEIDDTECISKSFPDFFENMKL